MSKLIPKSEYKGPQYSQVIAKMKSEEPQAYNRLQVANARSLQPTSEIIRWTDSNDKQRTSTTNIGMSSADPIGQLYVEGVVLNPIFKGIGKGLSAIIKNSPKFSYVINSNIPGIKSKKLAERTINSTKIKSSPEFQYSELVLKKTKRRPAYYAGELKPSASQRRHAENIKKRLNKFREDSDINISPSKVWVAADNSFGNSSGWFSNISKGNLLLRKGEKPSTILNTQVHESISHGTDDIIENMQNKKVIDYYKKFGDLVKDSNQNIKYKNASQWYEVRATMNELLYNLANKYKKQNINIYKNIKRVFSDNSDDELMQIVRSTNGYGTDYYNAYLSNPDVVNRIKYMLQALPVGTGLIMNTKNEQQTR